MPLPDYVPVIIQPQIVVHITREEYEQGLLERVARNFNEHELTIAALDMHREGLTTKQVSQLTGEPVYRQRKKLKNLYESDFLQKRGHKYFVTDENLEDIRKSFSPKAILLSAEFMTEKQKEILYQIIDG